MAALRNLGLLMLSGFTSIGVAQSPQSQPLTAHKLGPEVAYVQGGGGNSGVIIGDKGVIVVDAKITSAAAKQLLDEIAKISSKPVNTVILTHSDRDHVNGLAAFPAGITVIAQENEKTEEEKALAAGGKDAPPADHLPNRVITQPKDDLTLDGVPVEVLHWGPAHTSGDLIVYLPKQRVVFTGDIITNRPDPLIHLEKNGSSEGWLETAKGIASLDADTFVPGHGPAESKDAIRQYITHAEEKRARIQKLVAEGKSLDEVKAAVGDAPPAQGGGGGFATFTEVVYRELSRK